MLMKTEELIKNNLAITKPLRADLAFSAGVVEEQPVGLSSEDTRLLLIKPGHRSWWNTKEPFMPWRTEKAEQSAAQRTAEKREKRKNQENPEHFAAPRKNSRKTRFAVIPGNRYGFLTAVEPTEGRKNGFTLWRCQCDCGREYLAASRELKNKRIPSCKDPACEYYDKAVKCGRHAEDFTGRRYGKLVVLGTAMSNTTAPSEDTIEQDTARQSSIVQNSIERNIIVSQDTFEQSMIKQNAINQKKIKRTPNGNILWFCKCDCGNFAEATSSELKRGYRKSCGCLSRPPLKDWIGHRFGMLTVESYAGKRNGAHYWKCICDCGNETEVCQSSLQSGHTISCGCQVKPVHEYKTLIDGTCVESLRSALMKGTIPKNNSSGVRGVYRDKKHERWVAQITFKGKTKHLGSFKSIEEARVARKQAEERCFGEFLEEYDRQTAVIATGGSSK